VEDIRPEFAQNLLALQPLQVCALLATNKRDRVLDPGGNKMKTVQSMLAEAEAEVPRISPDEAKKLVGRADVLFLDVREPAEVATSGKVPGALAIPRGLVEFRADPASALHDAAFDRSKTVVAYCASGGRSALVGKTLKDMGYSNVRNLGGFKGWLEAGGEVEKG
jgi:rhodanese-related sulfurtransferase